MNESDQVATRYLLGALSEAEASAVEQKYFADPQLFQRLVEAENDLVDKYARGSLPPEMRDRFENYYLNHPERRQRAKFASALVAKVDQINKVTADDTESWWSRLLALVQGPRFAWGLAVVILLVSACGIWFLFESRRLKQQLVRNEAERVRQAEREHDLQNQIAGERARADQLASELERLRPEQQTAQPGPTPSTPATLATLVLTISGARSGATGPPATLVIAPGTEKARVQLNLRENDYPTYTVVIQTADGQQIFKSDALHPTSKRGASLVAIAPAKIFRNGDYILTLKGVDSNGAAEDISRSLFRVRHDHR